MAREHAILLVSIWDDPDFIALEAMQQTVFFSLIANRDLSWCGVAPYLPKRIAGHCKGLTERKVVASIDALTEARFLLVDNGTDEIAVRTFVRHDKIINSPNVTKAMGRAVGLVRSDDLRDAIKGELSRLLAAQPDAKGWASLDAAYPELMAEVIAKGSPKGSANPSGIRSLKGA